MPLEPFKVVREDGWKKDNNGRYGEAIIIKWPRQITQWALTLEECKRLELVIAAVRSQDQANKLLLQAERLMDESNDLIGKGPVCEV